MNERTRREFVKASAGLVPGVVLGAAASASANEEKAARRVIAGGAIAAFSRAVVHGSVAYVSGVLGTKAGLRDLASPEFEGQCKQAMENLKASIEAAGSRLDKVLRCGCYLTEASDFEAMNRIYKEYFPKDPPARSTIVVKELVVPGAKFEIDCVTALG